jgi:PAS domain S-box-containing protein
MSEAIRDSLLQQTREKSMDDRVEQKVIERWRQHGSGSEAPISATEVSMHHISLVPNGINHEVGATALKGVMAAPQLTYVHGLDGRIIFVNKFATDYCGLTLENIQTDDFLPRPFHPDDAERVREVFGNALERVAPFELELRLRRYDGQYGWFSLLYHPLLARRIP